MVSVLGWLLAALFLSFWLAELSNRRAAWATEAKVASRLMATRSVLNDCQRLLTQRGNEIEKMTDDEQEMYNQIAQGWRCKR